MKKIFLALFVLLAFANVAFAQSDILKPTGLLKGDMAKFFYDVQDRQLNRCFNSGALANSTANVAIAAAINYTKNGVFGQIAAEDIAMAGATQDVSLTKMYVFTYNTTTATTEIVIGSAGVTDINKIVPTTSNIIYGAAKIVTPSTHQYVPGTTALGTNNTVTYYNISVVPNRVTVKSE